MIRGDHFLELLCLLVERSVSRAFVQRYLKGISAREEEPSIGYI